MKLSKTLESPQKRKYTKQSNFIRKEPKIYSKNHTLFKDKSAYYNLIDRLNETHEFTELLNKNNMIIKKTTPGFATIFHEPTGKCTVCTWTKETTIAYKKYKVITFSETIKNR